jgi:cyclopropane fatty-acyl-phospholipid synthase-like methyltransferase
MIERFRQTMQRRAITDIAVVQADVLRLDSLPGSWTDYDLIVSASMLEYLPRARLSAGLSGLRRLLKEGGCFVLFLTRRNWLTRPLIGRWWEANLYRAEELQEAFRDAGFESIVFRPFPRPFRHLALWGHIVEAHR